MKCQCNALLKAESLDFLELEYGVRKYASRYSKVTLTQASSRTAGASSSSERRAWARPTWPWRSVTSRFSVAQM